MHPVPSAKSALKALLEARSAWAEVDIRDDPPTEKEDVSVYMFWFEPTRIPVDGWASLGNQRRRIEFGLGFSIEALIQGDDGRTAEDAVWVLFEDLMSALKADPRLGGTLQQVDDVTGEMVNAAAPNLWQARFTGAIACTSNAY